MSICFSSVAKTIFIIFLDFVTDREKLLALLKTCQSDKFIEKFDYLVGKITEMIGNNSILTTRGKQTLKQFLIRYKEKWNAARRNVPYFKSKNQQWLKSKLKVEYTSSVIICSKPGRPPLDFSECSERTKRRKTESLHSKYTSKQLTYAAQMQLREEGKIYSAAIIKDIVFSSPERATKYKNAYDKLDTTPSVYTPDKALSLVVEAKLTKFQYNIIRNTAKQNNCNIYPNYETITVAKKGSYPKNKTVTESAAEVPLQDLLDHTTSRLLQSIEEVIITRSPSELTQLNLITKWDCDGSFGLREYKQKFFIQIYLMLTFF